MAADVQARLWPQLRRDYGAGLTVTAAQVERSAERAGLPPQALALCYAATLSESGFAEASPPHATEYAALRQVLQACAPRRSVSSGIEPAPLNLDAYAGAGDTTFHGS